MIQRIQSMWLFLAFIATLLMFFFPLADISVGGVNYVMKYRGIYKLSVEGLTKYSFSYPLAIIQFLIKKRILQMRICVFSSILVIALVGLIYYFSYFMIENPEVSYGFASILPFIVFVLILMARNSIKKDEKLVRSVDRIR